MNDPNELAATNHFPEEAQLLEEPALVLPPQKGYARLSWLIILALVGLLAARTALRDDDAEGGQQERLQDIVFEMQARYMIGAGNFMPDNAKQVYEQARPMDRGSPEQRLRFVIVAAELAGPDEALRKALELQPVLRDDGNPRRMRLGNILVALHRDYVAGGFWAPSLTQDDRAYLREELPWFGALALQPREGLIPRPGLAAPAGAAPAVVVDQLLPDPDERERLLAPAFNTLGTALGAFGSACFLGLVGFAGLVLFLVLLAKRQLGSGLECGSCHGGVYAETFALFLVCFVGLNLSVHMLPWDVSPLVKISFVMLASLSALVWPVLRGISWAQVRHDIGWNLGANPLMEPALGLATYVLTLPLVLIGVIVTLVLMALQNQLGVGLGGLAQHQPVHPIVELLVRATPLERFMIFIDACILAPIVEETMFRGVLYRHIRELSCRWSWLASVLFSAIVVSFVFAVIHPQGLVAVPVLMALAFGFSIAREWRGSLIPCMVAHGLNNGLVLLVVTLLVAE